MVLNVYKKDTLARCYYIALSPNNNNSHNKHTITLIFNIYLKPLIPSYLTS